MNQQQSILEGYYYSISLYEDNAAKFHEGKYNEMSQVNWDYVKEFQNQADAEIQIQNKKVEDAITAYDSLEAASKKAGSNITQQQLDDAKKQIQNEKDKLQEILRTTKNELDKNGKTWLENSSTVLSKLTNEKVEWKKTADGQVQMYIDGVEQGKPMAEKAAEDITMGVLSEFDQKAEAEGAGKNVITGFTNGEGNMSLQNTAFRVAASFGSSIISRIKASLGEHSPSRFTKQFGKWLIQGLGIGMESEEDNILSQATDFGEGVINALNGSLGDGVSFNALDGIKASIPSALGLSTSFADTSDTARASELEQISLINSFKEALSQMKIEMDDQEMGSFVDKTVTRLVYN